MATGQSEREKRLARELRVRRELEEKQRMLEIIKKESSRVSQLLASADWRNAKLVTFQSAHYSESLHFWDDYRRVADEDYALLPIIQTHRRARGMQDTVYARSDGKLFLGYQGNRCGQQSAYGGDYTYLPDVVTLDYRRYWTYNNVKALVYALEEYTTPELTTISPE